VLERISLLMLVGGILFEIITGVLNIQYDYIFGFSFYTAHYYGAWVFIAGFLIHIAIKIPRMWTGLRSMSMRDVGAPAVPTRVLNRINRTLWLPPNPLADDQPSRRPRTRRRRHAVHGGDHRRAGTRRFHPSDRTAATTRTYPRHGPQRLSGQQNGIRCRHFSGPHR
jgi:hypothetical protein